MAQPRVIGADADFTSMVVGSLIVQAWHRETSPAGLDALESAIAVAHRQSDRTAFLILVDEGATPPTSQARARIAGIMRGNERNAAGALVFRGTGFKASMIRGVVTGLNMLSGYPFPYRTFASFQPAMAWLRTATELPHGVEAHVRPLLLEPASDAAV